MLAQKLFQIAPDGGTPEIHENDCETTLTGRAADRHQHHAK
jgi:hypothetical protein